MTPLEWFFVGASIVSVLGAWLTGIAYWPGRAIHRLNEEGHARSQGILERMDQRWQEAFERMDQRADERHRESLQAVEALRR
jgi:hypothetical protein